MANIVKTGEGDILLLVNVLAGEIIEALTIPIVNTILGFYYLWRFVTPIIGVILRLQKSNIICGGKIFTLQFASPESDVATRNDKMFAIGERLKKTENKIEGNLIFRQTLNPIRVLLSVEASIC